MANSLYDLSVPAFLQTVTAVPGFLDRAKFPPLCDARLGQRLVTSVA